MVHAVGGLRDTVKPFNPFEKSGTGGLAAAAAAALLLGGGLLSAAGGLRRQAGRAARNRRRRRPERARFGMPSRARGLDLRRCGRAGRSRPRARPHPPAGWTFDFADAGRFRSALGDALYTYREHRESFRGLQERGMQQDLSWEHAAELYEDVLVQVGGPCWFEVFVRGVRCERANIGVEKESGAGWGAPLACPFAAALG